MGWLANYTERYSFDIDNTNVDSDLTNFPIFLDLSNTTTALREWLNDNAKADGSDIRFTLDDGTTTLYYERDNWLKSGGEATGEFYIKVPNVDSAAVTTLYIYCGYSSASEGEAATSVWSDYAGVWHFEGDVVDSSGNNTTGSASGGSYTSGTVGQGYETNYSTDNINLGSGSAIDNFFSGGATVTYAAEHMGNAYGMIFYKFASTPVANSGPQFSVLGGIGTRYLYFEYTRGTGGSPTTGTWTSPSGSVPTYTGYNVFTVVYDKDTLADPVLYIDGVSQSLTEVNTPSGTARNDAAGTLYVNNRASLDLGANRRAEEFRIIKEELSADWIKFEYKNLTQSDNEIQNWTLETLLTDTKVINSEYVLEVLSSKAVNSEYLGTLNASPAINSEYTLAFSTAKTVNGEYTLGLSNTQEINSEYLLSVPVTKNVNSEYTLGLTLSSSINPEYILGLIRTRDINAEYVLGLGLNKNINTEYVLGLNLIQNVSTEYLAGLDFSGGINTEHNLLLNNLYNINSEYVLGLGIAKVINTEYTLSLNLVKSTPIDYLITLGLNKNILSEYSLLLNNLYNANVEHLLGLGFTKSLYVEYLGGIQVLPELNVEYTLDNAGLILVTKSTPIEYTLALSKNSSIGVEYVREVSLVKNSPIEYVRELNLTRDINSEYILNLDFSEQIDIGIEVAVGPLAGRIIWVLPSRGTDWTIPARGKQWILISRPVQWVLIDR